MEEELNYLSEKIETLEVNLRNLDMLCVGSKDYEYSQQKVKHEKEMLENILNALTIQQLT